MAVIIFGAAVLAVLFLVLSIIFKGLSAIFEGVLEMAGTVIGLALFGGMIAGVLFVIYLIGNAIVTDELKYLGSGIIILFVTVVVLIGIVMTFFGTLIMLIMSVIHFIRAAIIGLIYGAYTLLDIIGGFCEKIFEFFLRVIKNQLIKN